MNSQHHPIFIFSSSQPQLIFNDEDRQTLTQCMLHIRTIDAAYLTRIFEFFDNLCETDTLIELVKHDDVIQKDLRFTIWLLKKYYFFNLFNQQIKKLQLIEKAILACQPEGADIKWYEVEDGDTVNSLGYFENDIFSLFREELESHPEIPVIIQETIEYLDPSCMKSRGNIEAVFDLAQYSFGKACKRIYDMFRMYDEDHLDIQEKDGAQFLKIAQYAMTHQLSKIDLKNCDVDQNEFLDFITTFACYLAYKRY